MCEKAQRNSLHDHRTCECWLKAQKLRRSGENHPRSHARLLPRKNRRSYASIANWQDGPRIKITRSVLTGRSSKRQSASCSFKVRTLSLHRKWLMRSRTLSPSGKCRIPKDYRLNRGVGVEGEEPRKRPRSPNCSRGPIIPTGRLYFSVRLLRRSDGCP